MTDPQPAPPPADLPAGPTAGAPAGAHAALHAAFRWDVPAQFNIAEVCCERWAREAPEQLAVLFERGNGERADLSYGVLQRKARRLSNALVRLGVQRGDRIAVVLPQRPQTAIALIGVLQMGAVAVPLSTLFGAEALAARLNDSGAKIVIADEGAMATLLAMRGECPSVTHLVACGRSEGKGDLSWTEALAAEKPAFATVRTAADDPALLIYTSGTTGPAKGAVIPHRALIGNLSGFVASQDWFTPDGGAFWSPADWAWTGGLMDALLPTLYFGRSIVASPARFDPEKAFALMEDFGVGHAFLFPTALRAMMQAVPDPRTRFPKLRLRAIMSAGEAVGEAVFAYCRDALGVVVNEMFGQTEMNYVVGNCGSYIAADGSRQPGWPARPGSMGRAYPGHRVAVIDEDGRECEAGIEGEVAVHAHDIHGAPDPVFFLGYWQNGAATAAKFTGAPFASWCRTGDRAVADADGYLWYRGRADDQFKSSGYRIGPGEIEACLARHPAVAQVAVVPKPDPRRGAVVKAFVVVRAGAAADDALALALQALVRTRLAPYETPKEIEFVDALPMTTTGKLQRSVLRRREAERAAERAAERVAGGEIGDGGDIAGAGAGDPRVDSIIATRADD